MSRSPDGTERFELHGVRASLACAAVPRAEVISGFDLAKGRPKPAVRAAPAGSVYWLDELEATPAALRKLAEIGLWPTEDYNDARRAEGFNRMTFAAYGTEELDHV
jgi:CRISPR-associated protein Cmr3